tara:strand:- start:3265 stop:4068 length:804 start_codon:yes stop_codon:yes gene_type:complete
MVSPSAGKAKRVTGPPTRKSPTGKVAAKKRVPTIRPQLPGKLTKPLPVKKAAPKKVTHPSAGGGSLSMGRTAFNSKPAKKKAAPKKAAPKKVVNRNPSRNLMSDRRGTNIPQAEQRKLLGSGKKAAAKKPAAKKPAAKKPAAKKPTGVLKTKAGAVRTSNKQPVRVKAPTSINPFPPRLKLPRFPGGIKKVIVGDRILESNKPGQKRGLHPAVKSRPPAKKKTAKKTPAKKTPAKKKTAKRTPERRAERAARRIEWGRPIRRKRKKK